jgi:hypothetical protein
MLRTVCLVVIVTLVLPGGLSVSPAAFAAAPTATPVPSNIFYWNRLDTDVTVLPTGDLRVVETWKLSFVKGVFGNGSRNITLRAGQDIRDIDVRVGGIALTEVPPKNVRTNTFTVTRTAGKPGQDGQIAINWNYPQMRSPSTTTFVVSYTASGVLTLDPAADSLGWQGVWMRTSSPVRAARITVHLPVGAEALNLRSDGAPATHAVASGAAVFTASGVISPTESLTAYVDFAHGFVNPVAPVDAIDSPTGTAEPGGDETPTPAG